MAPCGSGFPAVAAFVDTGGFSTISSRTLLGDLIELANGKSVAGASPEQGPFPIRPPASSSTPMSTSRPARQRRTLQQLRARAGVKRLRAVRAGRFAVLRPEATIAGPNVGQALEQVAQILHPDSE